MAILHQPSCLYCRHGPVPVGASVMAGAGDSLRKTPEEAEAERAALQQTQSENLKAARL